MRLNQFLARAGVCSRRGGDELIRRGAVTVNGEIIKDLGRQVVPEKDAVKVDGKRVFTENTQYFLYNKPEGVMSTMEDPEGRKHLGDVVRTLGGGRLYPVGRLDYNTAGLLLLTNDGDLTQRLLHPKFQVARTYSAKIQGILTKDEFAKLAAGVRLEDGWAKAEVTPVLKMQTNSYVDVTVREGRNRLVRRMFEAMGHPVVKLKRVAFGPLVLGPLTTGEVRRMTPEEVKELKAFAARGPGLAPTKAGQKPLGSAHRAPSGPGGSGPKRSFEARGEGRPKKSFGGFGHGGPQKEFGGTSKGGPKKSSGGFDSRGPKKSLGGPREGGPRKFSSDFDHRGPKKEFGGYGKDGPKKSLGGPREGGPRKFSSDFDHRGPKKEFGGYGKGGPKKSSGGPHHDGSRKPSGGFGHRAPKRDSGGHGPARFRVK
jgi:23S rRNA pseudouridine2605 synthase